MKYKYKIGDKVLYKKTIYTNKVCKCCGNEETDSKEIKKEGIITERKYQTFYRLGNLTETEVKTLPDGTKQYKPYIPEFSIIKPEPSYTIGKQDYPEDGIIRKKSDKTL